MFACDSETSISLQGLIGQTAGCLFSCWFGASVGVFLWSRFLILGSLDDRPDEVHLAGLSGGGTFPLSWGQGQSKWQFSHSSRWLPLKPWLLLSSDQVCWAFLASAPFAQCMLCHMGCGLKERLVIPQGSRNCGKVQGMEHSLYKTHLQERKENLRLYPFLRTILSLDKYSLWWKNGNIIFISSSFPLSQFQYHLDGCKQQGLQYNYFMNN